MARVFQDTREARTLGKKKAPWYVEWRQNGRRRSMKIGSHKEANEFAALKESERLHRQNGLPVQKLWSEFRAEYEKTVLPRVRAKSVRTAEKYLQVLKQFEQTMKPKYVSEIDVRAINEFQAARISAPGKKKGETLSLATVRSELGTVFAILGAAKEFGYLPTVPTIKKPKPDEEEHRFMRADHFEAIYAACKGARMPRRHVHPGQLYEPADWWRALLGTVWATGMRISAVLALRWADADLSSGILLSRARSNKRKRDTRHRVGPVVVAQLETIRQLADPRMFPWNHDRRTLDCEWDRIQTAAGIKLECHKSHEHTESCHLYGFHDIRYAHATYNHGRVDARQLQEQMGHASAEMTKHYIQFAEQQAPKIYDAFMPGCLQTPESATQQQAAQG